jgi:uncharacterized membrane protein (DUF106 family)
VYTLHRIFGALLGALIFPFRGLDPLWALTVLSLLSGLLFLLIFKWTSNQEAIFQAKQRVKAHLLELLLFADDMVLSLRAQRDLFLANLSYLRQTLRPVLVLLIPVVLLLVQIDAWYARQPLAVGDTTVLRVSLAAHAPPGLEPRLELPEGLALTAPPLRIPSLREIDFRLRAEADGDYQIRVLAGDETVEKRLRVGRGLEPLAAEVWQPSLLHSLLLPAEPPLPSGSAIQSIALQYPPRDLTLFGWNIHWLVFFFVMSVVPAYLVKGLFGIEV